MTITTLAADAASAPLRADNDNYRGGLRSLRWLIRRDPVAGLAVLRRLRAAGAANMQAPNDNAPSTCAADDGEAHEVPDTVIGADTMAESPQGGTDDVAPEMLHEVRPTISEMVADLLRVRFVRRSDGAEIRVDGMNSVPTLQATAAGTRAYLAGMTFMIHRRATPQGGIMSSYTDRNGDERKPAVLANKPRGGKRPHRTQAAIRAYLDTPAAIASPMRVEGYTHPLSGEPALIDMLAPTPEASAAAAALADAYANTSALPVIKVFPPAIAKGARFVAGIVGSKPTATVPAPQWQERDHEPLPDVLEEVAAGGTLHSIGVALGFRAGYADRAGKRALLAAAASLVAANDNVAKKVAA